MCTLGALLHSPQPCADGGAQRRNRWRGRGLRQRPRLHCTPPGRPGDTAAWWTALPEVHVVAFDVGTEAEALYTTQVGLSGAFVAFASRPSAVALGAAVEKQLGREATVSGVPPLALLLLAQEAGYTVHVVPPGVAFDAPTDVRDDTGRAEAGRQSDETDPYTRAAQQRAAEAVRRAMLLGLSRLQGAIAAATYGDDATPAASYHDDDSDAGTTMPSAASAVALALRRISRAKLEALFAAPQSQTGESGQQ